jgi:hypothetical protein
MARGKRLLTDLIVDRYVNLELFYRKQEHQPNGCITWTGPKNNAGYGFIGFRRQLQDNEPASSYQTRMMTVHRLAFMIKHNRLPAKPNVNHTCHNKLCVNPDHLTEGTQSEKLSAMRRDGWNMGGCPKGQHRPYNHKQHNRSYRYSEEEIQWIRTAAVEDIATKYTMEYDRALTKQWAFRHGYTWLPCPPYERKKRGRQKATSK